MLRAMPLAAAVAADTLYALFFCGFADADDFAYDYSLPFSLLLLPR